MHAFSSITFCTYPHFLSKTHFLRYIAISVKISLVIYDKFAIGYDKALAPFERWFLRSWRRQTLSKLPENARILEIGAGTGLNFPFYPKSETAVASEISIEMIDIAQEKSNGITILQADAEHLPFEDNYFDAAFATLVFCSIADPHQAFSELRRVLKTDGRLILLEHVRPNGVLGYVFDVLNLFTVALIDDHFNRETADIAGKSGFKVTSLTRKALGAVNLIVCDLN